MEKLPVSEYSERKREEREQMYEDAFENAKYNVIYPKPLTESYYLDLKDRAEFKSKDWYLSTPLKNYALAVRNLYCAVMVAFNNTIYQPIELPEYVKNSAGFMAQNLQVNMQTLETLAKNLTLAEKDLIDALSRNNTTMQARCNKHKNIKQLRDFAAKAWLVYDNLKTDNFYHAIVDFKTRNADKDMNLDRNVALVSMGHYKTKNFVKTKVKSYFATSGARTPFAYKHGNSIKLYQGLIAKDLFGEIMEMFGGYNYEQNEENLLAQQNNVKDPKAKKVIDFYKNYADVKIIYKAVFDVIDDLNKGYDVNYIDMEYLEINNEKRDVYVKAQIYLNQINELLNITEQDETYNFIIKDCMHLQNKLNQALTELEPYHTKFEENKKKNIEEFRKNFSPKITIE